MKSEFHKNHPNSEGHTFTRFIFLGLPGHASIGPAWFRLARAVDDVSPYHMLIDTPLPTETLSQDGATGHP